jgi:hypothetical protein
MKWKNFQRFGIGVLAVAGIAGVLFGGEGPRLGNVYWISSPSLQDYRVTVSQAVQVGNRYLAVLFLKPRNPEKARALVTQYGSISRVAPAWMGPGWEVIQVGEGEYGNPLTMNPRTPSEDMASTSYLFPRSWSGT